MNEGMAKGTPAGKDAVKEALLQLRAEGVAVDMPEEAEGKEDTTQAERIREAYENSIEYRIGCQIMDGLTQGYALTSDDAEAMITGAYAPKSSELVGARAAELLSKKGAKGELKGTLKATWRMKLSLKC